VAISGSIAEPSCLNEGESSIGDSGTFSEIRGRFPISSDSVRREQSENVPESRKTSPNLDSVYQAQDAASEIDFDFRVSIQKGVAQQTGAVAQPDRLKDR